MHHCLKEEQYLFKAKYVPFNFNRHKGPLPPLRSVTVTGATPVRTLFYKCCLVTLTTVGYAAIC